jgi:glycosyltransferase involved in cell wall biosynthesis
MRKNIAVNATALISGGGLSILKQFIDNRDNNFYHIFIAEGVVFDYDSYDNVKFWLIPSKNIFERIYWDSFGLRKFLRKRKIKISLAISLQNTTMNVGKAPQIVYLHQGLCLADKKWSFLKKTERSYAFYKHIYPLFILLHHSRKVSFVVQTQWMKDALSLKFQIPFESIYNIKPDVLRSDMCLESTVNEKNIIFYPSTGEKFKNHEIIFLALSKIQKTIGLSESFKFVVTFKKHDFLEIQKLSDKYSNLTNNIEFVGKLSYEDVNRYYRECKAVVFPSQIESFGLPLIEAASYGKKILALDTPFSKEVLEGYEGVVYLPNQVDDWAKNICKLIKNDQQEQFSSFKPSFKKTWKSFFNLVNQIQRKHLDVQK